MAYNAEYAVRIAKVKTSTKKNPYCLYITFGPRAHIKDKYNAVEVTIFPGKLSFRFFTTEVKRFGGPYFSRGTTANSKKTKITVTKSSIKRVAIYNEDFIKKLEGFEGEYPDASVNPTRNFTSTDDYVCWINIINKESYTNMYKNTSTEYSHKKPVVTPEVVRRYIDKQYEDIEANNATEKTKNPDCIADILDSPKENDLVSEEDVKNAVNAVMSTNYAPASFSEMLQKQARSINEGLNKLFGVPAEPMEINPENDPRNHVNELFKELTYTAHKCTDEIQSSMADIFDYQLRKVHVTYEEANKNIKLQQILLRYIKLQDEIEELFGGSNDVL
ncbi:MAG: hypothetical protein J6U54_07685 [Clostridiales bacterium]|nr:hypothetical protein [Clostridiales bacterium]